MIETVDQVFIEFDGQQLTVTSDVPDAISYFRRNYSRMIVPRATDGIGELRVLRSESGYVVQGWKEVAYATPIDSLYDDLRRQVLLLFVRARTDLLWLHSGAVEREGRALLVSAPSSRGKSTLVTHLCARGWKLLSDEVAPIIMQTCEVIPFPQMPRRRLYPGRAISTVEFDTFRFEEIEIGAESIRREPVEIGAIVFPSFHVGVASQLTRATTGDAAMEIIRNLMNFVDHKGGAVEQAAIMAGRIPCYELTYSDGSDAATIVDALQRV